MINTPTLLTLYGEETYNSFSSLSPRCKQIILKWPVMSRQQRRAALTAYPELLGVWPIIAKIGTAIVGAIPKGVQAIKNAVNKKKKTEKAKSDKAKKEAQAAALLAQQIEQEKQRKAQQIKTILMIGLPVAAIGGIMLLKKKR